MKKKHFPIIFNTLLLSELEKAAEHNERVRNVFRPTMNAIKEYNTKEEVCITFVEEITDGKTKRPDIHSIRTYIFSNKNVEEMVDNNDSGIFRDTVDIDIEFVQEIDQIKILEEDGNNLFKKKQFQEAIDLYIKSMDHIDKMQKRDKNKFDILENEEDKMLLSQSYSNLAVCLGHIGHECENVVHYANQALKMFDGTNVKAWYWRAFALYQMKDYFNVYYD